LLFWGDSNCPFFDKIDKYKAKKGIILTTEPHNIENLKKLDVIYCESTPIYEQVRANGLYAVKAFGTDVDFYAPDEKVIKDVDFFYPATFSPWKRQSLISSLGNKLVCVGTVQPDGKKEYENCLLRGVHIIEGYYPPETIRLLYQKAKFVPIPAIHGSERTVLEAMSMNIMPTVNKNNKRALSYIEEYIKSGCLTPRDFVIQNYSHRVYADQILKGISG